MAAQTITTEGETVPLSEVAIAHEPDLTIRVIDYGRKFMRWVEDDPIPTKATDFQVNKEVLKKSSPVFSAMLGPNWREGQQKVVELHEDTFIDTTAMRVWFQILHGEWDPKKDVEDIDYIDLLHMFEAAEKYAIKPEMAKGWFSAWWDINEPKLNLLMARALLYPCWAMEDVRAFACVTKFVVHEARNRIALYNPTPHRGLLLPDHVLGQLNIAKSDLKVMFDTQLWRPVQKLLDEDNICDCGESLLHQSKRLTISKLWPLEEALRYNGIGDLLRLLETPAAGRARDVEEQSSQAEATRAKKKDSEASKNSSSGCMQCHLLGESVKEAIRTIRERFQGLCLVCMTMSDSEEDNNEQQYFACGEDKQWDRHCSQKGLEHGENTWYHSYSGCRPFYERKKHWQDKRREEERELQEISQRLEGAMAGLMMDPN